MASTDNGDAAAQQAQSGRAQRRAQATGHIPGEYVAKKQAERKATGLPEVPDQSAWYGMHERTARSLERMPYSPRDRGEPNVN